MPTETAPRPRTEVVQDLFEALIRFNRSLRARGADWTNVVQDLTRGDIVTLGVLESRGSIRPGQIANALLVDPSVVSRQLAGLARLGLIHRGADPADRRAELITLTPEGRDRLHRARTTMCEALAQRLDHLDVEDLLRATAVVEDLDDRLHQPVVGPTTATSKDTHA